MSNPFISRYDKPFLSVPEQIEHLRKHGLDIPDEINAADALRRLGYYRLSGYLHYFRDHTNSHFRNGTTLSQVLDLYSFDDRLRSITLNGIAIFEVALRFHIGHRLGRRNRFAHRMGAYFESEPSLWRASAETIKRAAYNEWLAIYDGQEHRSRENFVLHFRKKYGKRLPIWAATEVMTFGALSELYSIIPQNDRDLIAARFGIIKADGAGDGGKFSKIINNLRHVRNLCAHHSRLWNRTFDVVIGASSNNNIPDLSHIDDLSGRKIYGTLAILRFLISRIDSESQWHTSALETVTDFPSRSGIRLSEMGFPDTWRTESIWSNNFAVDKIQITSLDAIDSVETLSRPEVIALLLPKYKKESEAKSWLRYLQKNKALIFHRVGPQSYFPSFQFRDNDICSMVAACNENILRRLSTVSLDERSQMNDAQSWWISKNIVLEGSRAPIELIESSPKQVLAWSKSWSCTDLSVL